MPCSSHRHRHVPCTRWVTLSDLSTSFISYLFISFIFLHFLPPLTFYFLDVVDCTRTSAEELGPPDKKNSITGHEPNEHFITEAYVEYTQESVTEQRFPEDFDYDDITIGQTLLNACRRRADHSEGKGLSSCLSSSSMSHDKTGKPVVCRDASHAQSHEIQRQHSESEQIGLSWTDKGSKSSLTVKRRFKSTNSRLIMTEEVYKN